MRTNLAYGLIASWLLLSGCSSLKSLEDSTRDWSADRLYQEAKASLTSGSYETAIQYYEKLEARYPLGRYAQQAQMDIAYAHYKAGEAEAAIAAADRFIKLYPRHANVDYIYYLKGLANYSQSLGVVERYLPVDLSQRDQGAARRSFRDFGELLKRFPDSQYAADAHQRMQHLRNRLAGYELHVANFYLRREAHLAAANRAQYVVTHYDGTDAVPGALLVLVRAYRQMGADKLAADALKVLEYNYPQHPELSKLKRAD